MFSITLSLIYLILTNRVSDGVNLIPIGTKGSYIYENGLHASLLFYEAQRSGKLPEDNRIEWRADSMLEDGKDVGHDLTGGYFDAGDQDKFGFPMAYTVTVLSWGLIDYEDAYSKAKELENIRKAIKWGTDYFIKIGNATQDHKLWGRPEDWPKDKVRPSYKVTEAHGGSDLTGETSAALAAASIAFKQTDRSYSELLLKHAKSLYIFADKYRETYTVEIEDAANFYKSWSGYGDELAWAAAWLLRATNDSHYKSEVDKHFKEFKELSDYSEFGWDSKVAGVQSLLADITGEDKYREMVTNFCNKTIHTISRTPKGLVFLGDWGSLKRAANAAFICLQAAKIGINSEEYQKFSETQIGYILGDTGRSFVVGVGVNPPTRAHHRGASCPDRPAICDQQQRNDPVPNPHILYGALVGGPDQNDTYFDSRTDWVHNEVSCDYNAAFTSALAALIHMKNSSNNCFN